jgi:hypothetical protein
MAKSFALSQRMRYVSQLQATGLLMVLLVSISGLISLLSIGTLVWVFRRPVAQNEERWNAMAREVADLRERAAYLDKNMAAMEKMISAMAPGREGVVAAPYPQERHVPLGSREPLSTPHSSVTSPGRDSLPIETQAKPQRVDLSTVQPLLDYNQARSMPLEDGEKWFSDRYPDLRRISCVNRSNFGSRQADLRFQFSSRGAFLAVAHGAEFLLFPLLTDKYAIARAILEGVFVYPLDSLEKLRLKRPALVERDADGGLVLAKNGHGEFEAPAASRPIPSGEGGLNHA